LNVRSRAGHALAAWIGLCGMPDPSGPAPASAAPLWLIATPDETARAASPIALDVVKPPGLSHWPEALTLKLMRDGKSWEVELPGVGVAATQDARRTYRGLLPADVFGLVRVELGGVDSNRLVLLISAPEGVDQVQPTVQGSASTASQRAQAVDPFVPSSEPALTANEPIYLAVGGRGGATARFQLSFKYRIFDPGSLPVAWLLAAGRLALRLYADLHLGRGRQIGPHPRYELIAPACSGWQQLLAKD
jgi:hypothetical protein